MLKKKRRILLSILCIFCIYNVIWYFGSMKRYLNFQNDFNKIEGAGVKLEIDKEDFQYSVECPRYLSWTGNVAVYKNDNAIIIWPDAFIKDEYEIGVVIGLENEGHQINLLNSTEAADSRSQDLLEQHSDAVGLLIEKANKEWGFNID